MLLRIITNIDEDGRVAAYRDDYEAVKGGYALTGYGLTEESAIASLERQERRLAKESALRQCDNCGRMAACRDVYVSYAGDSTVCEECSS